MSEEEYQFVEMEGAHAVSVMALFNHYIENGFSAYFEEKLPDTMFARFMEITEGYPRIVAQGLSDEVAGFAFLHPYHQAPTFCRTAEAMFFIHPDHTGNGLGKLMLNLVIEQAKKIGVDNILSSISSLNPTSIMFHARNGFEECGRLPNVGRKFGKDFDVVYMQRMINHIDNLSSSEDVA